MVSSYRFSSPDFVFVYLAGHHFWEGLFENEDIKFIRTFAAQGLIGSAHMLVAVIVPDRIPEDLERVLRAREREIERIVGAHGLTVSFYHIRGRTVAGLLSARRDICKLTAGYHRRVIWSVNYFNAGLGMLIKRKLPDTSLHFSMMGLVPEEELRYSEAGLPIRLARWLVLETLCRCSLSHSDTVSSVSHRFDRFVTSKYRLDPSKTSVLPCNYDQSTFFVDRELRQHFRRKYNIHDHQTLVLFSGKLNEWQLPDVLFSFFRNLQKQDAKGALRFLVLSFDHDKARALTERHVVRNVLIDAASGPDLNGIYNAADIGVATRSADWVSKVSSPVKIPEYLATQNSLVMLESIGDYGEALKGKPYALVKKDPTALLDTGLGEILNLRKPDAADLEEIVMKYSLEASIPILSSILARHFP